MTASAHVDERAVNHSANSALLPKFLTTAAIFVLRRVMVATASQSNRSRAKTCWSVAAKPFRSLPSSSRVARSQGCRGGSSFRATSATQTGRGTYPGRLTVKAGPGQIVPQREGIPGQSRPSSHSRLRHRRCSAAIRREETISVRTGGTQAFTEFIRSVREWLFDATFRQQRLGGLECL